MKKTDKIAIVTGASSGMGLAIAKRFIQNDIISIMVARDHDKLKKAAEKINCRNRTIIFSADVRDQKQVKYVVNSVYRKFKKIDILVNCAGLSIHGPFEDINEIDWDEVIDTNLKGTFLFCRSVWPIMKKQKHGHILTISSASGLRGYSWGSIYCASKSGTIGLMDALSQEGQEIGIKITNICPGQVDTDIWSRQDPVVNKSREKMLKPEAIADLVYYVISRPENEHFKEVIIHPFAIQPYLRGRNRGPRGKKYDINNREDKKTFRI